LIENYHGQTLLCRTTYENKEITGRISFDPNSITIRLVGFEDFLYVRDNEEVHLQLENNRFCTVTPFWTSSGTHSTATYRSHYLDIEARQVITGFRAWTHNDRVKDIHFGFSDTNRIFEAPDIRKKISACAIGEDPDTKIISASIGGVKITVSYGLSRSWSDDRYLSSEPYGHIEFEEERAIGEVGEFLGMLHTFLSFSTGLAVRTKNYSLNAHENREVPMMGGGSVPERFYLTWPSKSLDQDKHHKYRRPTSVLRCFNENDRKSTEECLIFWMKNWKKWKPAFHGLHLATMEGSKFETNRIINACKWLDSTPGAQQEKVNDETELGKISNAAIKMAESLGLDIKDRLLGVISCLRTESRNSLLQRLIEKAVKDPDSRKNILKDIQKAYGIRGSFAHSKFYYTSDNDFGDYIRCTQAVEALAFLLLYRELPLPSDHFWGHEANFMSYFSY